MRSSSTPRPLPTGGRHSKPPPPLISTSDSSSSRTAKPEVAEEAKAGSGGAPATPAEGTGRVALEWTVKPSFNPKLLPTWGGKLTHGFGEKQKCWTSKNSIESYIDELHNKVETLVYHSFGDIQGGDKATSNGVGGGGGGGGGGGEEQENVRVVSKRRGDFWDRLALPRGDPKIADYKVESEIEEVLDEGNEIPGGDMPDNRLTTVLRVRRKIHQLRSNPDALYQLRKRIQQYKKEYHMSKLSLSSGKNLVRENKKSASMTRGEMLRRQAERQAQQREHLEAVRRAHTILMERRHEEKLLVVNRREIRKQRMKEMRQLKKRQREVLTKIVVVGLAHHVWKFALWEGREENRKKKEKAEAAAKIQRKWAKRKETQKGKRFRRSVKVLRRYCHALAFTRRYNKKKRSADMIKLFLKQYESSNFIKIMRNYRYRVIQCQRYWRSFVSITKQRLKLLALHWDKKVKEKSRKDRKKEAADKKRAKTAMVDSRAILESVKSNKPGMKKKPVPLKRKASNRSTIKMSRKMTMTMNKLQAYHSAHASPADMKRKPKVLKGIRHALLREALHERRKEYRALLVQKKQEQLNLKRQSTILSVNDARLLIRSTEEASTNFLSGKLMAERSKKEIAPVFLVLASFDTETMFQLIEEGIERTLRRQREEQEFSLEINSVVGGGGSTFMTQG